MSLIFTSCADDFQRNKKITHDNFIGLKVFKQEGNPVSRMQMYDELGEGDEQKRLISDLKSSYTMSKVGQYFGLFILLQSFLNSDNSTTALLLGTGMMSAGYYFENENSKSLMPFINEFNSKDGVSFRVVPDHERRNYSPAIGYNLSF